MLHICIYTICHIYVYIHTICYIYVYTLYVTTNRVRIISYNLLRIYNFSRYLLVTGYLCIKNIQVILPLNVIEFRFAYCIYIFYK